MTPGSLALGSTAPEGALRSFRVAPEAIVTIALVATLSVQSLPGIGRLPAAMANFVILIGFMSSIVFLWRPRPLTIDLRYPLLAPIALFVTYACVSILYGDFGLTARKLATLHLTTGDQSYVTEALQRIIQILFCIVAMEIVRRSGLSTIRIIKVWLWGLLASVIVHFGVVLSVGTTDGRPGTFAEGNFAGLFYVFSLFIALEYGRLESRTAGRFFVLVSLFGLVLARSSTSFVALGVALIARQMLARTVTLKQKLKRLAGLVVVVAIPATLLITGNDFGLTNKLLTQEVTPESFSRIDRILSLFTALQIFLDAPVFGSGLQSYGFIANNYLDGGPFEAVYDFSFRRIPNNIYAEIGAELGVVGLIIFFFIIFRIVQLVYKSPQDRNRNAMAGLIATLVYWLAFPTYSVIFVWAFFGLTLRYSRALSSRRIASRTILDHNYGS